MNLFERAFMKQFIATAFFFLFSGPLLFAQNDSIMIVNAEWETQEIAPGITWKHRQFDGLFNSNQSINIIEITMNRKNRIAFAFEPAERKQTSRFGKEAGALAAINGTFFDVKNGGSVDFLKVDDRVINDNRLLKDGTRARHQRAALVIKKGKLHIARWDGTPDWEKQIKAKNIMLTGPMLVWQGQQAVPDSSDFNIARHPRSALALTGKNRLLFITIDGRHANAAGMDLFELSKVLRWLKVQNGINLDGGGSTALWIHNQPDNGVVNYPSDNKKWDHEGERKVANVVLVKRLKSE